MNCWKCGAEMAESESFCPACGAFVAGNLDETQILLLSDDPGKTEVMPVVEGRHAAHARRSADDPALTHVLTPVKNDFSEGARGQDQADLTRAIPVVEGSMGVPVAMADAGKTQMMSAVDANPRHSAKTPRRKDDGPRVVYGEPRVRPSWEDSVSAVDISGLDNSQSINLHEASPAQAHLAELTARPEKPAKTPLNLPSVLESSSSEGPSRAKTEPTAPTNKGSDDGKYKKIAIVMTVLAVIVVAFAVFFGVYSQVKQDQIAHETTNVQVVVEATGYADGVGTGMPLHLEGTDLDGNSVSEDRVALPGLTEFALKRGNYTVSCQGDAIDCTGAFFQHMVDTVTFTVDENGYHTTGAATTESGGRPLLSYEMVLSMVMTDDQLEGVRTWAAARQLNTETVDALIEKVKSAREAAVNAQLEEAVQEIEDREQAAAEAEAQAAIDAKTSALAANPTEVMVGATLSLTGTLQRVSKSKSETGTSWNGVWYVLVLPRAMTVEGQSITEVQVSFVQGDTSTRIMDGAEEELFEEPWESAVDKTITVTGTLAAGDGSAQYLHSYCLSGSNLRTTF